MKNRLTLLSLFITLCSISHAQIGIQQHATWHYDWSNGFEFGTIKTHYVGDTLIAGENAKKFSSRRYTFVGNPNGYFTLSDSSDVRMDFTTENQDSLLWWDGSTFQVLFDYSSQAGDTRMFFLDPSITGFCGSAAFAETVSTSQINLGQNYRQLNLSCATTAPMRIYGLYNERIGAYGSNGTYAWIFPTQGWCIDPNQIPDESPLYSFRCFKDDSLEVNPNNLDCDYYLNHLSLKEKKLEQFSVYPQPFSSTLTIELKQNYFEDMKYQVHDLLGNLVAKGDISQEKNTISLTFLQNGVYTLSILDARNTTLSQSKLIKQD